MKGLKFVIINLIIVGLIVTTSATKRSSRRRKLREESSEESSNENDRRNPNEYRSRSSSSAYSEASGTYKMYNKNSGRWITKHFLKHIEPASKSKKQDSSNGPELSENIKVGQQVDGWGKIAGPEECARQCVTDEQPKICYFDWTAEQYRTLGGSCDLCVPKTNSSITTDCQCIYGDGYNVSGIMSVNRMFPGPSIQVCLGDLVVVDMTNNIDGNQLTIHWHGIYQKNWQHYDGVPFVTQCPIGSRSTFRYQWMAQNIGTHWWHSHTGLQQAKMLEGMIVIRQPKEDDDNHRLYDRDDLDNHIFLSDWMHSLPDQHFPGTSGPPLIGQRPDNILINGQGQWLNPETGTFTNTPLAVLNVERGIRYRFRMVNTGSWDCPMQLTIHNHDLTIIASDGENVRPKVVNTITTFPAERYDFILNANQRPGAYWIQVRLIGFCFDQEIVQWGILRYKTPGLLTQPQITRPTYHRPLPVGIVFNDINEVCDSSNPRAVCAKNLESSEPVDPRILAEKTDVQLFLPFTFYNYNSSELFEPGTYKMFIEPGGGPTGVVPSIDGITNFLPTSPLLTQSNNIPRSQICNGSRRPRHCNNSPVCECTHVIDIPLDSSVEMIIYDNDRTANLSHPIHLHGYGYHVMAQGSQDHVQITPENKHKALQLDRQKYKLNSYSRPPVKDTLAVPPNGYTIVRFIADNPGYWYLHCHILHHLISGMSLVLHVGTQRDVPPTPPGFPTCGDYKPPISSHYMN